MVYRKSESWLFSMVTVSIASFKPFIKISYLSLHTEAANTCVQSFSVIHLPNVRQARFSYRSPAINQHHLMLG